MSSPTDATRTDEGDLTALVLRWQQLRQGGRAPSVAELCAGRPDLAAEVERRVRALSLAEETLIHEQPVPAPADDARFAPVPGYEILGELGRGGMGVVYKARQTALNRVVALKMILSGAHAGADELARFRTEAESIARLQHPGIVAVFEVGEHQGRPFLSLEFCAGGGLDKKLNGVPVQPREAAVLVRKLAEAVQAAHEAKVVHRDLKPANVLLTADGTPKVTDFGLARKLDEQGMTQTGSVMGTPSYMAPEQAQGKKDMGPLADVYALGAILYECLTGRAPFRAATTFDTLDQVQKADPVPPRALQPAVPRDLETVCLKCLRKEPHKRYASAAELADDLRRFLDGEVIRARRAGPAERALKWCRRHPTAAALAATVALAVAGFLALGLWHNRQVQAERDAARRERDDAEAAREQARARAAEASDAREETEKALTLSRQRLALNSLAYGRACAVLARLATATDEQTLREARREYVVIRDWLQLTAEGPVKRELARYEEVRSKWAGGPAPDELRLRSLAFARACHETWVGAAGAEAPAYERKVRQLLYARACRAADRLAASKHPDDVRLDRQEFWELYWGEMGVVESRDVEGAMVRVGRALEAWREGPAPAELAEAARSLRHACKLPES
jgi:hypothetical protein